MLANVGGIDRKLRTAEGHANLGLRYVTANAREQ